MKPLAIYIHVPFCARKCAYCDFASFAGREDAWSDYFAALHAEMDAWVDRLRAYEARSVFFGGGTPSLVPAAYIQDALNHLRRLLPLSPDCEITLEANPGTLTAAKLEAYRCAGVNRLSIGVQSFDAALLRELGRIHTPEQAASAVRLASEAGFENLSIDLMYALPGQSMAQWSETLAQAVALPVQHISAYSLIVEPGTEMEQRVERGEAHIPDDDLVNEMQRLAVHRLAEAGFARYEISNFARAGYESRHNLTYWQDGDYLGLGSAAHSLVENERFSNPPELARYLAGERMCERTVRSLRDHREEVLMLSTRTLRGLDMARWRAEFGEEFVQGHARQLRKLENYGLIEIEGDFLRLTPVGLELQDSVVLELMDD
ncbi:MAG: radical SAM family heme chaperone HemW [Clostridia bacterium]|nr:radical SAM family heme chaperone HemW [Clostridia bacterium]